MAHVHANKLQAQNKLNSNVMLNLFVCLYSPPKALAELSLTTLVHFLPMVLMQLFRVLLHSSKEMEGVKNHVLM